MSISRGSDSIMHISILSANSFRNVQDKISDFIGVLKELIHKGCQVVVFVWFCVRVCLFVVVVVIQCITNSSRIIVTNSGRQ